MTEIQGCKVQSNISAMDFNENYTQFVTGGRDSIKIFQLSLQSECWFDCKKTITRYRNATNSNKTCVSQLSWNKWGGEDILIGTTSGHVIVCDINNAFKVILQAKSHEGNINNVVWLPKSPNLFLTSSFENYLKLWDTRSPNPEIQQFNYAQNNKIRDVKFSPHRQDLFAVQCSNKFEIFDIRKPKKELMTHDIQHNELQGIGIQWDPIKHNRISSAVSKEIQIFNLEGQQLIHSDTLSHYHLIKSFYWSKQKQNHFGVLGEHPQKNIFFYNLNDKNRISYMYGGHNRPIDYWMMNSSESLLVSASNIKEKKENNKIGNSGLIVVQHTSNFFDPNQSKFNHPLVFDQHSSLAFSLNLEETDTKSFSYLRKSKIKQSFPIVCSVSYPSRTSNFKEELLYLHRHYVFEGRNEQIAQNNAMIARTLGKNICAEVWKNLFTLAYPPINQKHSLQSIFQEKLNLDIQIIDFRFMLHNEQQIIKQSTPIRITRVLQWLVDQNELQTAVAIATCLISKSPDLIPLQFMEQIFTPYIDLLRSYELYDEACEAIAATKRQELIKKTEENTNYSISCGSCNKNVSKGECKCNLLCVLCQGSLSQRLVIWCKYCGHGGHATEYQKWFKEDKKSICPHGCGHQCFNFDDF